MPPLPTHLFAFLESGVSILASTRDAGLVPHACKPTGVRVHEGGERITLYFPAQPCRQALENLADNGELAASFSEIATHRTLQIKGKAVSIRDPDAEERAFVERYRTLAGGQFMSAGIPRTITDRLTVWPCRAVDVEVRDVFVQTPGPDAGAPLSG